MEHKTPAKRKGMSVSRHERQNSSEAPTHAFRRAERRYKIYKDQPLDLSDVLDFANLSQNSEANRALIVPVSSPNDSPKVYTLKGIEGFYFICNPFSPSEHLQWSLRCLSTYSNPLSSNSNLHAHHPLTHLSSSFPYFLSSSDLITHLRWVTLGYHYDWTNRRYDPASKGDFPVELTKLCQTLASHTSSSIFTPQAAIVNFYGLETVLCGHLDDAELEFDWPIVSISFGSSAIFLIGGEKREDEPIHAMMVRSGDVVIMGGSSRLRYHGVPRVISGTWPNLDVENEVKRMDESEEKDQMTRVLEYLQTARININVRQVVREGTKDEEWGVIEQQKKKKKVEGGVSSMGTIS